MSKQKQCRACSAVKDLDEFYLGEGGKSGRRSICIACTKAAANARKAELQKQSQPPGEGVVCDVTDTSQSITIVSRTIRTLDAAITEAKIDLSVWSVERYTISKWDQGMKLKSHAYAGKTSEDDENKVLIVKDKPVVNELWMVKLWLARKVPKHVEDGIDALIERLKAFAPKLPKIKAKQIADPHMLEVSICDAHFAKLCWAPETGHNFDLRIIESIYEEAINNLVAKSAGFSFDKILLPIGNDFFNVDGPGNTTTNGTPQDVDGRYIKMFVAGHMAVVKAIAVLRSIAPVEVVWVPGNHDRTSSWHLAYALKASFHDDDRVKVDDTPTQRKYVLYGKNLVGFTHGNEENHNSLPAIMATERPDLWAASQWRTFHLGHYHKRRETRHVGVDTHDGVVVAVLPSLSAHDVWTVKKGYVGNRAADAYIYSRDNGPVGYVTANVTGEMTVV